MNAATISTSIALTFVPPSLFAQGAWIRSVGDLPGGPVSSAAFDVSADGRYVTGDAAIAGSGHAFWRDMLGGIVDTGDLPGGRDTSNGSGISPDGRFIVGRSNSSNGWEAMRWSAETGMMSLGRLPDSLAAEGFDVSLDGNVVVGLGSVGGGQARAWRWTPSTGMVNLGTFPGGEAGSSFCEGVSADGRIVIGSSYTAKNVENGFRWTEETGMIALVDLPGGDANNHARAISDNGLWITGEASSDRGGEAVLWNADGMPLGLGHLPSPSPSVHAFGVSNDGRVVVGEANGLGMIWTPTWGMRHLSDVLTDYGVDIHEAGWDQLLYAKAVSMDGSTIVGYGYNLEGRTEGYVIHLPIPAPGVFSLLAAASIATVRRRRR